MTRTIQVTLCNDPADMGAGGTEEDVASFVALVRERLAKLYPVAAVTIETSPHAGTFVSDSFDQEHDVHGEIQRAWEAWCVGERADDADDPPTTFAEIGRVST